VRERGIASAQEAMLFRVVHKSLPVAFGDPGNK